MNDNAVCKAAKSASKSPELLARFTDLLLKKSSKNPEEQEMEQLLNDVVRQSTSKSDSTDGYFQVH